MVAQTEKRILNHLQALGVIWHGVLVCLANFLKTRQDGPEVSLDRVILGLAIGSLRWRSVVMYLAMFQAPVVVMIAV